MMAARVVSKARSPSIAIPIDPIIDWTLSFVLLTSLILIVRLGSAGAALFLACSFALAVRRPRLAIASITRNLWMLALPILALLSTVWSNYPETTFRSSIQLILTVIAGIWLASCVKPRTVMQALTAALTCVLIGCLVHGGVGYDDPGGEFPLIGLFDSKNQLAATGVMTLLAAAALIIDRAQPRFVRIGAVGSLAIAPIVVIEAKSAGALIFCFPALMALLGLWRLASWPKMGRLAVVTGTLISGAVILIVSAFLFDDFGGVLDALGKDSSLTGRAYLWEQANEYIAERPILGVGYQGFWQIDNPRAQDLWFANHVAAGSGFNFHNLYYNTWVELGFFGVVLLIALLISITVRLLVVTLSGRPAAPQFLAAGILVYHLGISGIEVALLYQFALGTVMFCLIWCYLDPRDPLGGAA